MYARLTLPIVLLGGAAHAQVPVEQSPVEQSPVEQSPVEQSPVERSPVERSPVERSPVEQLKVAANDFDFGNYEAVVARLRPMVESLAVAGAFPGKADRLEALRLYGIACTLTRRDTAAEGAFLLLLREEPRTRLDARLVPSEAVSFFDQVRARHKSELLAAYRQTRPRYSFALDLIPIAGQLQNRQWKKGIAFGSVELGLLFGTVTTGALLLSWQGDNHTFPGHTHDYGPLRYTNNICFGALLAVTAAGVIDAFVVGSRRREREKQFESQLGL
jgi:hypothetical protein